MPTLSVSEAQINTAYQWLCLQRKHYPPNADIWDFRFRWDVHKFVLLNKINGGAYRFSPLKCIRKNDGEYIHLWSSKDALVIKILASVLTQSLSLSTSCTHIKGHGGLKQSINHINAELPNYQYVCKTDVKGYYESIDHFLLMEQIYHQVADKNIRYYLWQIIHRTIESGGNYRDINKGISRGCSISPILGALYLKGLDDAFQKKGLFYLRYMDDIIILSKTRWHNRKAIKLMNQYFNQLKVKQHPDKTFIGKIEKGFDFLGYHFSRKPLRVATVTIKKHVLRYHRLYEQQIKKKATSNEMALVLGGYVKRWHSCCQDGLSFKIKIAIRHKRPPVGVTKELLSSVLG